MLPDPCPNIGYYRQGRPAFPEPKRPQFFPEILRGYPAQFQVIWLYFRDYPMAPADGSEIARLRGGSARYHKLCIKLLRQNGLLIEVPYYEKGWHGHLLTHYRVCTEAEQAQAKPYTAAHNKRTDKAKDKLQNGPSVPGEGQ